MGLEDKSGQDLRRIRERIQGKRQAYTSYNLSQAQNDLLRTFFDLAQEYDANEDFYRVCVVALSEFLGLESRLYLFDKTHEYLRLVCGSKEGLLAEPLPAPDYIQLGSRPPGESHSFFAPIYRKPSAQTNGGTSSAAQMLAGILEIYAPREISAAERFFLRKYTNRIGYNLHNRMIAHENIRHLKFINNLVMDIEHNVVTPNMYFRHLIKQLKERVEEIGKLERMLGEIHRAEGLPGPPCEMVLNQVARLHQSLQVSHRELQEHHANYSLFLESLLRRDHFTQGRFVLRSRKCAIDRDIVGPQLEHFLYRFKARGIAVEKPEDMAGEELFLRVDLGLLSQVYANLFSNAVKYTSEILDRHGRPRKAMAYGREIVAHYFGAGQNGVKFNVFTTGPHLNPSEAEGIFADGVRGEQSFDQPGTGHGLSFIKQVVEIHGGTTGYEPTEEGNNFYFVLPLPDPEKSEGSEADRGPIV